MKRVLTVLVLLSGAYILHAEQMTFVTTLSSPLGTFAQLETADPSASASAPLVNFCNSRSSVGTVTLKGADSYLRTLHLKNGTTLGGNVAQWRIAEGLHINDGGTLEGGRLMANTVTVSGAASASARSQVTDTLYVSAVTVKGAKADSLTISGQTETAGTGSGTTLYWSNEYTCDYKGAGQSSGTMKREGDVRSISPGTPLSDTCDDSMNVFQGYKNTSCNDVSYRIIISNLGCYKFNTDGTPVGVCSSGAAYADFPQVPASDCSNTFGGGTACLCSNLPYSVSTDLTKRTWCSDGKCYTLPAGEAEDRLLIGSRAVQALLNTIYGNYNASPAPVSVSNKFLRKSSPDGKTWTWSDVSGSYSGTAIFHECIFPYKGKYYGVYIRAGVVERTMVPEGGGEGGCDGPEKYTSYLLKSR